MRCLFVLLYRLRKNGSVAAGRAANTVPLGPNAQDKNSAARQLGWMPRVQLNKEHQRLERPRPVVTLFQRESYKRK